MCEAVFAIELLMGKGGAFALFSRSSSFAVFFSHAGSTGNQVIHSRPQFANIRKQRRERGKSSRFPHTETDPLICRSFLKKKNIRSDEEAK